MNKKQQKQLNDEEYKTALEKKVEELKKENRRLKRDATRLGNDNSIFRAEVLSLRDDYEKLMREYKKEVNDFSNEIQLLELRNERYNALLRTLHCMMNDCSTHRSLIKNNADALAQHGTIEDDKLATAQMCFFNFFSIQIAKLRAILKNHDVKLEHASNNK